MAWVATDEGRRGLRAPTTLSLPDFEVMEYPRIYASPNGERLCIDGHNCRRLVDRHMDTLQDLSPFGTPQTGHVRAVSDDSVYVSCFRSIEAGYKLCRFEFDGTTSSLVASYVPAQHTIFGGFTLAPNNLALVSCSNRIVALDARTLEERYRFQLPPEVRVSVVADEVFCCDDQTRCLHVYSLAGEYLRAIRGPWREPHLVTHYKGRLYVSEYRGGDEEEWGREYGPDGEELYDEEDWSAEKQAAGLRIFVVTPQGETLQVFDQFPTPIEEVASMTVVGNRLIVCCLNLGEDDTSTVYELMGA